jgi:hypothetical protein
MAESLLRDLQCRAAKPRPTRTDNSLKSDARSSPRAHARILAALRQPDCHLLSTRGCSETEFVRLRPPKNQPLANVFGHFSSATRTEIVGLTGFATRICWIRRRVRLARVAPVAKGCVRPALVVRLHGNPDARTSLPSGAAAIHKRSPPIDLRQSSAVCP